MLATQPHQNLDQFQNQFQVATVALFLNGLSLRFYRGIGDKKQRIGPFKDFNFFIGANNAGKSTVLNFIAESIPFPDAPSRRDVKPRSALSQYRGKITGELEVGIAIPTEKFALAAKDAIAKDSRTHQLVETIDKIVMNIDVGGLVWLARARSASHDWEIDNETLTSEWPRIMDDVRWRDLWAVLTKQGMGSFKEHWLPETLTRIVQLQPLPLPEVKLIPALRQIGPKGTQLNDFSGVGLIDRLAEVQSPDHDKREEHELFKRVNRFLQSVLGKEDTQIEIPHNREHVLVHMDNKVLPLASLGMGIHEVIMIASFCTLTEKSIVCIEEPEIHLHPLLQRKLINYLRENTDNQYFIATHSASFIDTPGAAIFHVSNDGDQTYVRSSILPSERHNICLDLGYKASDIVQSNAIIWVEGPSDRIYVKHWLSAVDPDLMEGTHFSIMFYGGRLLSHLSAHSDEINDFIALKALNRHMALIMDSDKSSAGAGINETKERLRTEISEGTGVVWITEGREIENYVDPVSLQAAVKKTHPRTYRGPSATGPYDHALFFVRSATQNSKKAAQDDDENRLIETDIDKVAVAKIVCEEPASLAVLDLRQRVGELVEMIRRANR